QFDIPGRALTFIAHRLLGGLRSGSRMGREDAGHERTFSGLGVDGDAAAMQLHERAHDGEPEARPAVLRAERVAFKSAENALLEFHRDTGTLVRAPEGDPA